VTTVISVENLGKQYLLCHQTQQGGYLALRDVLADGARSLGRRLLGRSGRPSGESEEFWALRNVSFDVKQGDRVGIIGRNGAGKSTLLKILSRVTEPTTGSVRIRGRVASLLEVGTGFHPELTGRENIYLNGAILGMSRSEIKRKFDEIVDFAEIEKFLDTPVKRYSSGMYVRLAFAVAAHLEPEILVVDEVLSVGDAQFQKKSLGKMDEGAKEGRTIIVVSHVMSTLQALCNRALLVKDGMIDEDGPVEAVISSYLRDGSTENHKSNLGDRGNRLGDGRAWFESITLLSRSDRPTNRLRTGEPGSIAIKVGTLRSRGRCSVAVEIKTSAGLSVFTSHHTDTLSWLELDGGGHSLSLRLQPNCLRPGDYLLTLGITDEYWNCLDLVKEALAFTIEPILSDEASFIDKRPGIVSIVLPWKLNE
jgi:lipopolysaccharide transport system ATP-binding protein